VIIFVSLIELLYNDRVLGKLEALNRGIVIRTGDVECGMWWGLGEVTLAVWK